jgi:GNAT superfamily N-acetyltransferase
MAVSDVVVRPIAAPDHAPWLDMWARYCAFYGADVPAAATAATWTRIVAAEDAVRGLVATDSSGAAIGFAHYVLHPFTWGTQPVCYLEDLFVEPRRRGGGAGRALIEHLVALGTARGWSRVYWMTQASNTVARRLYDGFAAADDFVRYTVALDDGPSG